MTFEAYRAPRKLCGLGNSFAKVNFWLRMAIPRRKNFGQPFVWVDTYSSACCEHLHEALALEAPWLAHGILSGNFLARMWKLRIG